MMRGDERSPTVHGATMGAQGRIALRIPMLAALWDTALWYPDDPRSSRDRALHQAAAEKLKDCWTKINFAASRIPALMTVVERGVPRTLSDLDAPDDLMIFLDCIILNLRIQADCVARTLPSLYRTHPQFGQLPRKDSFRDFANWFLREPRAVRIDPQHVAALKNNYNWFLRLAEGGTKHGVRDSIIHHFGTFQFRADRVYAHGFTVSPEVRLMAQDRMESNDIRRELAEIVAGFFQYLDALYKGVVVRHPDLQDKLREHARAVRLRPFHGEMESTWLYPCADDEP
jgi:hypothetical protein